MDTNYNSVFLSTAYWAPVQYFTKIISFGKHNIETCEIYQKQSYRNRCEIYGPNGKQSLFIPVLRGSFHKTYIRDIKISYDTLWQKNHLKSIEAAYRSSPFYEYYIDDILPFYNKKYTFLLDYNNEILQTCKKWLSINCETLFTLKYHANVDGIDMREIIHPKNNFFENDKKFVPIKYYQGFEMRHGFLPNLSIIDLIFNTGNNAQMVLK